MKKCSKEKQKQLGALIDSRAEWERRAMKTPGILQVDNSAEKPCVSFFQVGDLKLFGTNLQ